jgi:hypothetical protein
MDCDGREARAERRLREKAAHERVPHDGLRQLSPFNDSVARPQARGRLPHAVAWVVCGEFEVGA